MVMRTYVKMYFSSEGAGPLDVVDDLKKMGFRTEVGEFDFSISWETPEQYGTIIKRLHSTLAGTRTRYTIMTRD
jgi:hypothetical protein